MMDHEKIVSGLEAWLDRELKSYKSGELMGISETVWRGKAIEDVLVKLAELKTTIKSQSLRSVFTKDGTKMLAVREDGTVIHKYTFDECSNPKVQ